MIKFIKPRKSSIINLYAISARKGYKEIVQDSVDSLYIKFKVLGYGIIISGWHLLLLIGLLALLSTSISNNLFSVIHLTFTEYLFINIGIALSAIILIKVLFSMITLICNIKVVRR